MYDFLLKNDGKSLIFHGFLCQNFPVVSPQQPPCLLGVCDNRWVGGNRVGRATDRHYPANCQCNGFRECGRDSVQTGVCGTPGVRRVRPPQVKRPVLLQDGSVHGKLYGANGADVCLLLEFWEVRQLTVCLPGRSVPVVRYRGPATLRDVPRVRRRKCSHG